MKNVTTLKSLSLYILISGLLLGGCKAPDKAPQEQVPIDASAVMVVNTSRLLTKIALDQLGELSAESLFGGKGANKPPADPNSDEARWKDLIENPTKMGVDLLEDAVLIVGEQKDKRPAYMASIMVMSDAEQFKAYLNNKPPRPLMGSDQEGNGFNYRIMQQGKSLLAWNEHFAMYLIDQTNGDLDLVKEASYILNLAPEHSMMEREPFRSFMESNRDIGLYVNTKSISELPKWMDGIEALSAELDFKDGELSLVMRHQFSDALEDKGFLENAGIQPAFEYIDFREPVAFANVQYSPSFLKNLLREEPKLRETIENTLEGSGISMDELEKLFTGKLLAACTGVTMLEKEVVEMEMDEEFNMVEKTVVKEVPTPELVLASESPENAWEAVMDGLIEQGVMERAGASSYQTAYPDLAGNTWRAHLHILSEHIFVVNTPESPAVQPPPPIGTSRLLEEFPSVVYLNLPHCIELLPAAALGKNQELFMKRLETFEMGIRSGENDSEMEVHLLLKLQDKEQNALIQLVELGKQWEGALPEVLSQ